MDITEILKKQVEELEKLVLLKDRRITELEEIVKNKSNNSELFRYTSGYICTDVCTDGLLHEYPNPWYATIPPNCKKCGKEVWSINKATYTASGTTTSYGTTS